MQRTGGWCGAIVLGIFLAGCGIEAARESGRVPASSQAADFDQMGFAAVRVPASSQAADFDQMGFAAVESSGGEETTTEEALSGAEVPSGEILQRKIIYTAEVDLVVEDFDPIPARIDQLVKKFGGYIAESEIRGTKGTRRSGRWRRPLRFHRRQRRIL